MRTVFITDITSYKAAVLARFIKRHYPGVRVAASDHRPAARRLHTRFADSVTILTCAPDAGAAYAEALGAEIRRAGADLLLPVNSKEIRVLMEHRGALGQAFDYAGGAALYQRLDDKGEFAALIARLGLPQPRAYESLDAPLPLVLKPARGSSAKGVEYINTASELQAARARHGLKPEGFVIQEYVRGEGIGFSGYFEEGRILQGYAHRRVAEYPVTGGSSAVREGYPYDDLTALRALIEKLLAAAPWSGFAMFELKRRGPGDFVFIECNPRIWGSIFQGLASGVNYLEPLLGPAAAPLPQGARRRTALFPLDALAASGYLRQGNFSALGDMLRGLPRTRFDINPFTDPGGFVALLMRGA